MVRPHALFVFGYILTIPAAWGFFYTQTLSMRLSPAKSFPKTFEIGENSPFSRKIKKNSKKCANL